LRLACYAAYVLIARNTIARNIPTTRYVSYELCMGREIGDVNKREMDEEGRMGK